MQQLTKLIEDTLRALLTEEEIHLYQVRAIPKQARFEVYLDGPGGIGIDECSRIHRGFLNLCEETEGLVGFQEDYSVSFSTPGLARKCQFPYDFQFYPEREFRFKLKDGREVDGRVQVRPDEKLLQVDTVTGESLEFNWSEVVQAGFKPIF
jgi:ribosome maturation factor RimP